MKATIARAGFLTTVQSRARTGFRGVGLSAGGALDLFLFEVLNQMVGNEAAAAGLEITAGMVRMSFADTRLLAWAGGEYDVKIGDLVIPAGHVATVQPGEELRLTGPRQGARGWLAISGGFDVPEILGSRSTDLRGAFGGWQGRSLRDGDIIPLKENPPGATKRMKSDRVSRWATSSDWTHPAAAPSLLRVIPGHDWGLFPRQAIARFLTEEFTVSAESDRMGVRLSGPKLLRPDHQDLVSEPVAPGTIQVPANGDPILLLGDCQTIGGYAKLAHVITVDLPRAVQLAPGTTVRFRQSSLPEAHDELGQRIRDFSFFRTGIGLTIS